MTSRQRYLLTVLTTLLAFNYLDRMALGVVLQAIKGDFHLTDSQLGFLGGIAFALFYSVMGVPIARWADRGNRVTVISLTAALWSVAVVLCGLAATFPQLLAARVAVAVGEAGCVPPALSLIADYFNRADRPKATAIYGFGGPLSILIGFFVAGRLGEIYGWRGLFILVGAPGLALAAWARLTLSEPRCGPVEPILTTVNKSAREPSMRAVLSALWANVTFRHLLLSLAVMFFFIYGVLTWQPTFLIRSYGLTSRTVGMDLALCCGLGGLLGSYLGGSWATRYASHDEQLQLKALSLAVVTAGLSFTASYLTTHLYLTLALSGVAFSALSTVNAPIFAAIQTIVPDQMRATSFALLYLVSNLIGMGFGPLAVGMISDTFRPWAGDESLHYALLMLAPGYLWAAWHVYRASQVVSQDLAAARV